MLSITKYSQTISDKDVVKPILYLVGIWISCCWCSASNYCNQEILAFKNFACLHLSNVWQNFSLSMQSVTKLKMSARGSAIRESVYPRCSYVVVKCIKPHGCKSVLEGEAFEAVKAMIN